ncbi:S8 family serine peptidase [Egicoccus sp. AB-alg6-2]|uniref:S8 family serine peptidase n=1 Tax=Egicoccus sp. AB-alg6-2 TaxID=3242692 RepID=UPI00359E4443
MAGWLPVLLLFAPAVALAAGDPYRGEQWSLDRIGVEDAWAATPRGEGVVVAVVDTGVDLDHPDLRERFVRDADGEVVGLDLVGEGPPQDEHGHGTLVAGVIAATADNGIGVAGIAPRARLLPIRVLDEVGAGEGRDVDAAIRWAVDHGADVINLSLESVKSSDRATVGPGAPTDAVRYAWDRGVVVVAAAGNAAAPRTEYPEDSPVLLVGAVDRDDRRAAFSSGVRADAVLAPGVDIVSTWCRDAGASRCEPGIHTYGLAEGTSFAAPHVSGALALLLSAGHGPEEAVERLRATAVDLGPPGPDPDHGHGRIDVGAAAATDLEVAALRPPVDAAAPDDEAGTGQAEPPAVAAEPTPAPEPAAQRGPEPPAAPDPEPQVVALPTEPSPPSPGHVAPDGVVHLVAAVCLGVTLATWSAVARRHV